MSYGIASQLLTRVALEQGQIVHPVAVVFVRVLQRGARGQLALHTGLDHVRGECARRTPRS